MDTTKANKKRADEIQDEADKKLDLTLTELFRLNGLEYKQHSSDQKKDKGIDFYSHVYDRVDHSQLLFFQIQNKGTDSRLRRVKKEGLSKIAFQLELRHIRQYYNEVWEPLLVFVCELSTGAIYWYAIQLDEALEERALSAKGKTLQVYIPCNNTIDAGNFERLLKDIEHSRQVQQIKKSGLSDIEADYEFIREAVQGMPVIDQALYAINLFEGVAVLPVQVLGKLYPFIGSSNRAYLYNSTLKTENEDLFDYLAGLSLEENRLYGNGIPCDAEESEKITQLMDFLAHNTIEHIDWAGRSPKAINRLCIHKLRLARGCECERCSYYKLDFLTANALVLADTEGGLEQLLRKGYTAYLLENYERAILLFKEVYKRARAENKISYALISNYNLKHLKRIVDFSYYEGNRSQLLKSLEGFPQRTFEADIKINYPYLLDIHRWIYDHRFIETATQSINEKIDDIAKVYNSDTRGGRNTNGHIQELISDFLRLYRFLEYNLVVYQNYYEFKTITARFFEGLIAMHALKNRESDRYREFPWSLLTIWIFHLDYDKGLFLLNKYDIKELPVSGADQVYENLLVMLENFTSAGEMTLQDRKSPLYSKAEEILKNVILLIAKVKFDDGQVDTLTAFIVKMLKGMDAKRNNLYGTVFQLVSHKHNINLSHLKELIFFLKDSGDIHTSAFSYSLKLFFENATADATEALILSLLEGEDFTAETLFGQEKLSETLGYGFTFLAQEKKDAVASLFIQKLESNFDPELYYTASIFDIIGFDEKLLARFISTVQDQTQRDKAFSRMLGNNEHFRLDQLINLMYKYNQDFGAVRYLSSYALKKEYYDWLMGLESFDYDRFDPYWILGYQTRFYFDAFRKSKQLKKALKKHMKKNYMEGVAKAFFRIY